MIKVFPSFLKETLNPFIKYLYFFSKINSLSFLKIPISPYIIHIFLNKINKLLNKPIRLFSSYHFQFLSLKKNPKNLSKQQITKFKQKNPKILNFPKNVNTTFSAFPQSLWPLSHYRKTKIIPFHRRCNDPLLTVPYFLVQLKDPLVLFPLQLLYNWCSRNPRFFPYCTNEINRWHWNRR